MKVWILIFILKGMPYWGGPAVIDGFTSEQKCQTAINQVAVATEGLMRDYKAKCIEVEK